MITFHEWLVRRDEGFFGGRTPAYYTFNNGGWAWINENGKLTPCPTCEIPPTPPGGWRNYQAVYHLNNKSWFDGSMQRQPDGSMKRQVI